MKRKVTCAALWSVCMVLLQCTPEKQPVAPSGFGEKTVHLDAAMASALGQYLRSYRLLAGEGVVPSADPLAHASGYLVRKVFGSAPSRKVIYHVGAALIEFSGPIDFKELIVVLGPGSMLRKSG
ncbi:hypothetical protein KKF84_14375, partial [Myxococcota bacterium]|nr:hypothetical protein [Myxococcota bacterium]